MVYDKYKMVLASRKTFMLIFFVSVFENECLNYVLDKNYNFASQAIFFSLNFCWSLEKILGKKYITLVWKFFVAI